MDRYLHETDAPTATACPGEPPPSQTRDFLARLNEGTGHELLDAYSANRNPATRNALALHYRLCAQIAARRTYKTLSRDARLMTELEDLEQVAFTFLLALIDKFDLSLGIPLSAFLAGRLRFAMIDECRRQGLMSRTDRVPGARVPKLVPLHKPGNRPGDSERTIAVQDPRPGPSQVFEARESRRIFLATLPRPHRLFVAYRYLRRLRLHQIARKFKVTLTRAIAFQNECLQAVATKFRVKVTLPLSQPRMPRKATAPARPAMSPAGPILPDPLRKARTFRKWLLARLPWTHRKLVAYRHFRNRDISWTAARLKIPPERASWLDREANALVLRALHAYPAIE